MKINIYTIYDSKATAFLPPFYMQTKGLAIRAFEESVNDPKSSFHKYPNDYQLFEIGTYDDATSEIIMHENKVTLGLAVDYIRQSELDLSQPDLLARWAEDNGFIRTSEEEDKYLS